MTAMMIAGWTTSSGYREVVQIMYMQGKNNLVF